MCWKILGQRGLAGQEIGAGEVCSTGLAVPSTDKETQKPCSTRPRQPFPVSVLFCDLILQLTGLFMVKK